MRIVSVEALEQDAVRRRLENGLPPTPEDWGKEIPNCQCWLCRAADWLAQKWRKITRKER